MSTSIRNKIEHNELPTRESLHDSGLTSGQHANMTDIKTALRAHEACTNLGAQDYLKQIGDFNIEDGKCVDNGSFRSAIDKMIEGYKLTEKMNDKIDPKMSKPDQATARDLNRAIATGDAEFASKALERFKGDPQSLRQFADQYNKVLKAAGSGVTARADGETLQLLDRTGKHAAISTNACTTANEFAALSASARFAMKYHPVLQTPLTAEQPSHRH